MPVLYARESLNIQYFPLGFSSGPDTLVLCRPEMPKGEPGALSHADCNDRRFADAAGVAAQGIALAARRELYPVGWAGLLSAAARSQQASDCQFYDADRSCRNLGTVRHQ